MSYAQPAPFPHMDWNHDCGLCRSRGCCNGQDVRKVLGKGGLMMRILLVCPHCDVIARETRGRGVAVVSGNHPTDCACPYCSVA